MNGLDQHPDRQQVLAELDRVLVSKSFKKKTTLRPLLEYLVKRNLDHPGAEITETSVGVEFFENPRFNPVDHSNVRESAKEIRRCLGEYYGGDGRNNSLRIELPMGTYAPVFKPQGVQESRPVLPPLAPPPPTGTMRRPFWRSQLFIAAMFILIGSLLASFLWFGHEAHCGLGITITSPAKNEEVVQRQTVEGKRGQENEWYCRCKDYLVVVDVDHRQWFIADRRLLRGTNWSVTADFGDNDTRPGTLYNVFVLSTTETLRKGVSPNIDGTQSPSVSVRRK